MRVLIVVPRFGEGLSGGAESAAREVASRLGSRGHAVEVLTSRAMSYVDWADAYPEGSGDDGSVRVHRLSVQQPRVLSEFNVLHDRVMAGPTPLHVQEAWMHAQGPVLRDFVPWLERRAASFDVVVFFSYLYWTTWAGLPVASARVPTVLVPLAHDEPPFHLPIIRQRLSLAHAMAFLTPEEERLVLARTRHGRLGIVTGLGVEAPEHRSMERRPSWLPDEPYLLYVGRIDPTKGVHELVTWFSAMQDREPRSLRLVLVGDLAHPIQSRPDVVIAGAVPDAERDAAMSGALALVNPSYFESFSLVIAESWARGRPVLATAASPVLSGQVKRSGGGIVFDGFLAFASAVEVLLAEPELGDALGDAGKRFVARELQWPVVMDRFEFLLGRAVDGSRLATAR